MNAYAIGTNYRSCLGRAVGLAPLFRSRAMVSSTVRDLGYRATWIGLGTLAKLSDEKFNAFTAVLTSCRAYLGDQGGIDLTNLPPIELKLPTASELMQVKMEELAPRDLSIYNKLSAARLDLTGIRTIITQARIHPGTAGKGSTASVRES